MSNYLVLTERVKNAIALGEGDYREFKTALEGRPSEKKPRSVKDIRNDISEALVAFANADGGDLLIGVEDDGAVTGIPHDQEQISLLLTSFSQCLMAGQTLPLLHATKLIFDGKAILFFAVSKGTTDVYQLSDGRCMARRGKETVPAVAKHIEFTRAEVRSREYDTEFVDGAATPDLDLQAVQLAADSYLKGLDPEKYLQQIGLAEYGPGGLRLRRAALLLFARDISKWHHHSFVRVIKVAGNELLSGEHYNVTADERITGSIPSLILRAWPSIRPLLTYKTEFGQDARFEQKYTYPESACQEALVNAIAHRDYTTSSGVEVFIFESRLEIRNPGALLSTLSIDDLRSLKGAHESRNSLVSRVLRENFRVMRELGEGMRRIFQVMSDSELEKPKLSSEANFFSVVLENKSFFTAQQEQWLLMFQQFQITTLQKRIILLGMNDREISPADIYKAMGTKDRDTYDREVTGLRHAGLLKEIRKNYVAKQIADTTSKPRQSVGRFKVQIPGVDRPKGFLGKIFGEEKGIPGDQIGKNIKAEATRHVPSSPRPRTPKTTAPPRPSLPPVRKEALDLRWLNSRPPKRDK